MVPWHPAQPKARVTLPHVMERMSLPFRRTVAGSRHLSASRHSPGLRGITATEAFM
jgi:hypothetical protein